MSEENNEKKTEKTTRTTEQKEKTLEIIVAVFLGVTALLTSWASWIGSLHGGNQSTNYTVSNNLSAEANSEYNTAMQNYMQDMMIWNQINEVLLDQQFAEESGDDLAAEKAEWRLDQLLNDNVTDSFLDAINWALEQEEAVSPFEMEGYVESYFDTYYDLIEQSDAILEQGKKDNSNGDAFGLVTVIYSVVLFMLGIVGTFKNLPNRYIVLAFSVAGFFFATIYMFTLPMPTGFSLSGFFGG